MKALLGKGGVILIGLIIFTYVEVWGEDWKFYGSNEMCLGYYDVQSITHPSKNIARVLVRMDWTEKGVINYFWDSGKKYENVSYSITLNEINCAEKMTHELSSTHYDNKGGVIYSFNSPSEWRFITPKSMNESLYKVVCK